MIGLIWNIRGIGNKLSQRRVKFLREVHKLQFLAIIEPMIPLNHEYMKRMFGFRGVHANISNKIWIFVDDSISLEILQDHEQFLHVKMESPLFPSAVLVTVVYAKCTRLLRSVLWEDLLDLQVPNDLPWILGGDFNAIVDPL
ncbi:hypothetical protein F511_32758 [Dorcoceras hygrometricum]|uniref:Endonuclease/exonuclease/phosphatase domain-containing protein n=1 Tax=Dorcoceras hygrometricum TaxID=472368 RepID=A0A2Z7BLS0_9LAMI|nr:hypothetical protein F511_32758 [Dorcoceras hygrometricum]